MEDRGSQMAGDGVPAFRRVWIVGFAGHRRLVEPAAVKAAIVTALREFRDGVEGELTGRASAAAGADLLFLEACRELGLAYSVVLPFPEERFQEDFDDDAEWARARTLIDGAANVEIVPGNEVAPEAYHLAAREILDVCDAMLFLWDGQPARGIGGTAESVGEVRERGLPHRIIEAETARMGPLVSQVPLPWRDDVIARLPAVPGVDRLFTELDRRAVRGAPRSRWFAAGSISLNQCATVIAGVLAVFGPGADLAAVVKFGIVVLAACLPWVGARLRINNQWVDDRLRAEMLRSLSASHAFAPPLRPFAAELLHDDAAFLRSAAWQMIGQRRPWQEERDRYLRQRLDGQIGYLASKGEHAAQRLKVFQTAFRIASSGAMLFGAVAIFKGVFKWQVPPFADRVLLSFLPVVLPAIAAWCLAMIPLFEHKRRANLYRQIVGRLKEKRAELAEAKCFTTAAQVVAASERLLLTELWEWAGTRGRK
ncbi:hypothetical protein OKA04_22520 [Luteolibacter flavescens]|uniref:SMODS and SLOG-associating 2TM effector domain-containing protein n=1 Tax=Luteolibacter flavescens TaxID=1859460 RepID=A0ABT3FVD6_9BACT|nr:hypothetical protein [Luteolibacter flavescens]MCW1887528.1 hypothetical protein [Luteolibacter flavescens]